MSRRVENLVAQPWDISTGSKTLTARRRKIAPKMSVITPPCCYYNIMNVAKATLFKKKPFCHTSRCRGGRRIQIEQQGILPWQFPLKYHILRFSDALTDGIVSSSLKSSLCSRRELGSKSLCRDASISRAFFFQHQKADWSECWNRILIS